MPEKSGTPLSPAAAPDPEGTWTFLTNHAHVLFCLVEEPEARLRDLADRVGITERAVARILSELEAGHYLSREKIGRRNRYIVHLQRPLRHPIEAHCRVAELVALVVRAGGQ
ncbi:MAG: winged helix-turn-helix transcriptional regulator [Nannocystis sp.]|nr:winged helix-turn-helix transcriptional regulator [Nannocystis sp.]